MPDDERDPARPQPRWAPTSTGSPALMCRAPFFKSASEWFAGTDRSRQLHDELLAALTPLVRRAQADGAVREDLEPADLPIVVHMLASVTQPLPKGDLTPQARERYFALVFDALRPPGARSALPGSPYDPFC